MIRLVSIGLESHKVPEDGQPHRAGFLGMKLDAHDVVRFYRCGKRASVFCNSYGIILRRRAVGMSVIYIGTLGDPGHQSRSRTNGKRVPSDMGDLLAGHKALAAAF